MRWYTATGVPSGNFVDLVPYLKLEIMSRLLKDRIGAVISGRKWWLDASR